MVKITGIEKNSHAAKAGILAGDMLISINGQAINDVLDYRFYQVNSHVSLKMVSTDGKERDIAIKKGEYEEFSFSMSRQMYSQNNVPFVYSVEGETYSSIARTYNLFIGEILRFNDVESDAELKPGTVVYLQAKKGRAARLVDKYVAEGGETLWEISQRFAVKLSALEKMNGVDASYLIRPEDTIVLR